jgi:hypothetical protein
VTQPRLRPARGIAFRIIYKGYDFFVVGFTKAIIGTIEGDVMTLDLLKLIGVCAYLYITLSLVRDTIR